MGSTPAAAVRYVSVRFDGPSGGVAPAGAGPGEVGARGAGGGRRPGVRVRIQQQAKQHPRDLAQIRYKFYIVAVFILVRRADRALGRLAGAASADDVVGRENRGGPGEDWPAWVTVRCHAGWGRAFHGGAAARRD